MPKSMIAKSIAVDFDGVISAYKGWQGKGVFEPPVDGCAKFLRELKGREWVIIVFTTRKETSMVRDYLAKHEIPFDFINYNPENITQGLSSKKVLADVYLDDRAIRFNGMWDNDLLDLIEISKVWWRK